MRIMVLSLSQRFKSLGLLDDARYGTKLCDKWLVGNIFAFRGALKVKSELFPDGRG